MLMLIYEFFQLFTLADFTLLTFLLFGDGRFQTILNILDFADKMKTQSVRCLITEHKKSETNECFRGMAFSGKNFQLLKGKQKLFSQSIN